MEDKAQRKTKSAKFISEVYSKCMDLFAKLTTETVKRFNFSETAKDFTTYELRKMVSTMPRIFVVERN